MFVPFRKNLYEPIAWILRIGGTFFFELFFDLKSLNNIDSGAVIVFHIWSLRVVIDCIRIVSAYHSVFAETQLGVTTKGRPSNNS